MSQINSRRRILGVFAHPDDETSSSAGTFTRYAHEGVEIHVAVATRGEPGSLGTGEMAVTREDLPAIREAELRSVLQMYGADPPILLGYRDQELATSDFEELVGKVASVMEKVSPQVVITFGPTGISHHDDHIAIHRATVEAFQRYRTYSDLEPRLFYVALPKEAAERYELNIHGPEIQPSVIIDIKEYKSVKIQALRMYRSQEDAQQLADTFEATPFDIEAFHQAYPPATDNQVTAGFWE